MTFTVDNITDHWRQAQAAGVRRRSVQAGWTDERTEALRQLVERRDTSLSAGSIGHLLGITRNSVIGKARRMGWPLPLASRTSYRTPREPKPRKPRPPRKPTRIERLFKSAPQEIEPALPYVPPFEQRCLLQQLTPGTCRFPYGEPGTPDFYFCGGQPVEDLPYCPHHCRIAFQPERPRPLRWGWR